MHSPVKYEVQILGRLDPTWITQIPVENVRQIPGSETGPITVFTATFRDQAELRGLLDRIYNLNLPLFSVQCIGARDGDVA